MSESTGTRIEDVRTVGIPVSDVERSLEFYQGTLGFEIRMDVPFGDGRRWVEVAAPGSPTSIALTPPGPGQSPGVDTGIRFTSGDVEADHASLKARGADVDPEIVRWPNAPPMFGLRDPDGNRLFVVQRMSEAEFSSRGRLKRFAVLVKSDETTESGAMPDASGLDQMTRFNQRMADAGMMLAADGFHSSADGARIQYSGGATKVVRGPFPEPRTLVAGYWIVQAGSLDEVVDVMREAPFGDGSELEIRQIFEAEEFGEAFTPELREREERQRKQMEAEQRRRAA
jgi:catechol 2,3-dioxygenase-like lactoylglutathione lyase family enzyme